MKRVAETGEPPVVIPVVVVAVDVHVTLVIPTVERGTLVRYAIHLTAHRRQVRSPSCIIRGIAMLQHIAPSIFVFGISTAALAEAVADAIPS